MKVLLVGEGPSELDGALRTLVSRLATTTFNIEQDRVSQRDIHAHHGKGKGYFKRTVRWMLEARKRGYDALILVIDQDGLPERTRELADAQQYDGTPLRRALGVAIRTFDAWMLADEKALTSVLGHPIPRQRDPEKITDPKRVCSELLENCVHAITQVRMYESVAGAVDIRVLENRCPDGFAPFAQRVREL